MDKAKLQEKFQAAVDHAQFKIDQMHKILAKPTLDVEEIQQISRVIDQLSKIKHLGEPATFDCVG